MSTVDAQIRSADAAICGNIESLVDQRGLLSQNVLSQLRNLIEGAAVLLHTGSSEAGFDYAAIESGLRFVKSKAKYNALGKFHGLILKSASHYTLDSDNSERLMLKYYEYLLRLRWLLIDTCGLEVLDNLDQFPVDQDPAMREYHEKISERVVALRPRRGNDGDAEDGERFYVHAKRPFFVGSRIFYEVSLTRAMNHVNKHERLIAFTDLDMADMYAVKLNLEQTSIDVLGQTMPIVVITHWHVSIRPCELDNFARLFNVRIKTSSGQAEYRYLMSDLTARAGSLLDLMDMPDDEYAAYRAAATARSRQQRIFLALDEARRIVRLGAPGSNLIRYLMLGMRNEVLKPQYNHETCARLSGLNLQFGCMPFDAMPFCSSPIRHVPRYWDLVESLDVKGRTHELVARRVQNNVEQHGVLYTPVADLEPFGNVVDLIGEFNRRLYRKHGHRRLVMDKGHVVISGYEDDTVEILKRLGERAANGVEGYTSAVDRWLDDAAPGIDDDLKRDALRALFDQSRVALIYGAAGTGKSTMVDHVAAYFHDKDKLFLAHTNPAKGNLERKVTAANSEFSTISSYLSRRHVRTEYDLLVIDECSTVCNSDLLAVLKKTTFKLIVLVGDVFQIESIQFGNWFSIARSFIPSESVFELTTPYRTSSKSLRSFWESVRGIDDDIAEVLARGGYSRILDQSLFERRHDDEITLCLNYDGLYGINNLNRFLQSGNPHPATTWREATYKVDDPILFHDSERFRPVIYNNLKGRIVGIATEPGRIQFDVELERSLTELDVDGVELEWVGESTVRFSVFDYDASDDDVDSLDVLVPFQVAYAVSIHKAQGLEYDSVKVVITEANDDDITHSIFYTAVTRPREYLQIYWTPETQHVVLENFDRADDRKDVRLLSARRGLSPVA